MLRVQSIKSWRRLEDGATHNFDENAEPRRVRLELNAAGTANLYLLDGDGSAFFLGLITGRETIEFAMPGGTGGLMVEGADVWFLTVDGDDTSFISADPTSFTKLVERKARNPEVEMMNALMQQNMKTMLETQANEFARLLDRRDAASRSASALASPEGAAASRASEPASDEPAGADVKPDKADAGNGTKTGS